MHWKTWLRYDLIECVFYFLQCHFVLYKLNSTQYAIKILIMRIATNLYENGLIKFDFNHGIGTQPINKCIMN